ncbi:MAG: bifunctional glutamate N-acetyltransferase/amino-acid acetyltransferase ArgJ [Rhizobiales bacterium]|nr:bifunctional glutamate N-acetyltransferase/amino-acid acetyltransferase ArgJ [Hyphomicrobiales bacterium]
MATKQSPLAPAGFPDLPDIDGVRFATAEAGIKYTNRRDLLLAVFDRGCQVAGVFTKSRCPSAPVEWCRDNISNGRARALVVNSGNANAFTGRKGSAATRETATAAAQAVDCQPDEVFLASTGVIGEPLDASKFSNLLGRLAETVSSGGWAAAAQTIMTTDTFAKGSSRTIQIDGQDVTINGIAKGAGMIAPDMATMLCFIFTDAPVSADILQHCLSRGIGGSFNSITVDSDTSTSDTVLLFATGAAAKRGVRAIDTKVDRRLRGFRSALNEVLVDLAQQVVRDGEGASKFITVEVDGAVSARSAKKVALSIANSPLVKTAVAGEDPNWGRVVMAVGKAGEPADRDMLAIWFGDIRVAFDGERDAAYDEDLAAKYMKNDEITIRVDLGLGRGKAQVWTCDLTKEYIAINADYRS